MKEVKQVRYLNIFALSCLLCFALTPHIAEAVSLSTLIRNLLNILNPLIVLFSALVILEFLWTMGKGILVSDDSGSRAEFQKALPLRIFIVFVTFSLWGIVAWVRATLGI